MAKVIKRADDGITHLRGVSASSALCGAVVSDSTVTDDVMCCPECARIALQAIEMSTKAERRDWRKL